MRGIDDVETMRAADPVLSGPRLLQWASMERFQDQGSHLGEFAGRYLVRCPRCDALAEVTRQRGLACGACSLVREPGADWFRSLDGESRSDAAAGADDGWRSESGGDLVRVRSSSR